MSTQELEAQINKATLETIVSLIPIYFAIVKFLLFAVAIFFSLVIVGVMLAGKILLSVLQMVETHQQKKRMVSV